MQNSQVWRFYRASNVNERRHRRLNAHVMRRLIAAMVKKNWIWRKGKQKFVDLGRGYDKEFWYVIRLLGRGQVESLGKSPRSCWLSAKHTKVTCFERKYKYTVSEIMPLASFFINSVKKEPNLIFLIHIIRKEFDTTCSCYTFVNRAWKMSPHLPCEMQNLFTRSKLCFPPKLHAVILYINVNFRQTVAEELLQALVGHGHNIAHVRSTYHVSIIYRF